MLNGLDGRKSGTIEGYSYSEANKNSGITWNKDVFLEYIKDPKAKIPATKMVFAGIKNEKEAGDLWAYVASFDKDGKTKWTTHSLFKSAEDRDGLIQSGMESGMRETMDRLAELVESML